MYKESSIERVNELLTWWLMKIKVNNAVSLFDINKYAEDLLVNLLNTVYDLNLVNLNHYEKYPGVDLGDKTAGVAFQVTTTVNISKIKDNLIAFESTFNKSYFQGIRFVILSLERSEISRLRRKCKSLRAGFPDFNPFVHIITIEDIVRAVTYLYSDNPRRFVRVLELLEKEIAGKDRHQTTANLNAGEEWKKIDEDSRQPVTVYPSIRLKRLTLENIKCYRHVELEFPTDDQCATWTVLVGDNGVGKTTLLHAVALCALGPELASKRIAFPDNMVRIGTDKGYMEAVFEISTNGNTGGDLPIRLNVKKGSKTFDIQIPDNENDAELVKQFIQARNRTDFDGWFVAGYGAVRNLLFTDDPSKFSRQDVVIDRVSSLFDPTKILIDPSSLYRFLKGDTSPFNELGAPPRLDGDTTETIRTLLDDLLPMIHFEETNGTETLATDFGSVPISELSEGYKSMLSWLAHLIVHLLRAVNWVGDIHVVRGIVLIDEVDLHLHPGWQQNVIPLLRKSFPKLQFIGCTHSPMTVGGADDDHIILLERDGNDILVEQELPSIRGWRADQILTGPLFGLDTTRGIIG